MAAGRRTPTWIPLGICVGAVLTLAATTIHSPAVPVVRAKPLVQPTAAPVNNLVLQNLSAGPANVEVVFHPQTPARPTARATGVAQQQGASTFIYQSSVPGIDRTARYSAVGSIMGQPPGWGLAIVVAKSWLATGAAAAYSGIEPAPKVYAPLVAKASQGLTTAINIQNTSSSTRVANYRLRLYAGGSGIALTSVPIRLAGRNATTVDLAGLDDRVVPPGYEGHAIIESMDAISVPLAANVIGTYSNSPRAAWAYEAIPSDMASPRLYAPLVRNQVGEHSSAIRVLNTEPNPVTVSVMYYGSAATPSCSGQVYSAQPFMVPANGSAWPPGPNPLPANCSAHAVIEQTGGSRLLAVVVDRSTTPSNFVASAYNAVTSVHHIAKIVAVPYWQSRHTPNRISSILHVMNAGNQPANVTLSLFDSIGSKLNCGAACSATVQPRSSSLLYFPNIPETIGSFGSALVASTQPVAVVAGTISETGTYDDVMFNGLPVTFPSPTPRTPTATPRPADTHSGLVNLSTRGVVRTGAEVMIAGFIVQGGALRVAVRAIGPDLGRRGVPGALRDPVVTLFRDGVEISRNDDWRAAPNAGEMQAMGLAPIDDREAAMLVSLEPGAYTAIMTGKSGATGIGLVEVLKVGGAGDLVNLSTRGVVGTGDDVMIGGFIVATEPTTVLLKAVGPDLARHGVPGSLQNPVLQIYSGSTVIAENDDWGQSYQADYLRANGLNPADGREPAILMTLPPGAYTAIVRGMGGTTGVGLVEVNRMPAHIRPREPRVVSGRLDADEQLAPDAHGGAGGYLPGY